MNQYEVTILYDPDLEIDLEKATGRIEKILTEGGGKIVKVDNWGKRKLAYRIKNHETAVYVFYTVELPAESVQKIEATLNITDEIIRFLIVKPDLKAIAKAEAAKAARAKRAAEHGEPADEAEDEEE